MALASFNSLRLLYSPEIFKTNAAAKQGSVYRKQFHAHAPERDKLKKSNLMKH